MKRLPALVALLLLSVLVALAQNNVQLSIEASPSRDILPPFPRFALRWLS